MLTYVTDGKRHLICIPYSIENLHKMARDLGIGRWWYEDRGKGHAHYDIPLRQKAVIETAARRVTTKELLNIIKEANERLGR